METKVGIENWDRVGVETIEGGTNWEIETTRKDRAIFREHTKFTKILSDEFFKLIDYGSEITSQTVHNILDKHNGDLNETQRVLLEKIAHRVLQRLDTQETATLPEDLKYRYDLVRENFGFPALVEGKSEVAVDSLGIMVIRLKDKELWEQYGGATRHGGHLKVGTTPSSAKIPEEIKKLIKRTVVYFDDPESPQQSEQTRRHEIFHALNSEFIEPEMKPEYDFSIEKEIFLSFKDEAVAYLLGNSEWAYDLRRLQSAIIPAHLKEKDEQQIFEYIEQQIGAKVRDEVLKKHGLTSFYDHERAPANKENNIQKAERQAEEEAETELKQFLKELRSAQRELARTSLLYYQKTLEDEKVGDQHEKFLLVLSSLSLKEVSYKLHKSDERTLNAEQMLQKYTNYSDIVYIAQEIRYLIPHFHLQIENLGFLIDKLENFANHLDEVLVGYQENERLQEKKFLSGLIDDCKLIERKKQGENNNKE